LVKGIDRERGSVCGQDVEQVWEIMLSVLHGNMIDTFVMKSYNNRRIPWTG
jgi:hypothetical protein